MGPFYWCLGGSFGFAGSLQSYGFIRKSQTGFVDFSIDLVSRRNIKCRSDDQDSRGKCDWTHRLF